MTTADAHAREDAPRADANEALRSRKVRSFVLRQGRTTSAQQRAFDAHWARYGIPVTGAERNFRELFGRSAPLVLEIGFGNGDQLLHAACADADRDYIGIEVHRPGVGRLLNGLAAADVSNARLYHHDAVEVLEREIGASVLDEVRIYFPDPWPKKRHQKRRLVQSDFVALLASRVAPGGRLHLATDWADYAEHMQSVLDHAPHWRRHAEHSESTRRPSWRTDTHFERRGMRLGHGVWDLVYERT